MPARLPRLPGTHPDLIGFYEAQLGDEEEPALGQRWFDMCSNNAALEYLSPTSGDLALAAASGSQKEAEAEPGSEIGDTARSGDTGVQYELLPTLQNVARTCGSLLGAEDAKHWRKLADLADWWNALPITENTGPSGTAGATTRRKLAVVEEMRSFRAPHGEEMLYRQHALLSLLPAASDSSSESGSRSDNQLKRLSASTGRSADPYDISFPIHPGAKESELVAAAVESGGGIKLTLEEAHNISAVFHVPAPRPWLHPAQNRHLDVLLRRPADSCTNVCPRRDAAENAILAAVVPALLGGRWLEVPVSRDISLGVVSILSARLSKGGELEAATARAVYLALGVSSSANCDQEGEARQHQELCQAKHERALCMALARRMIAELAAAEATANGAKCGGALRASTQLRLAKAIVEQSTQAVEASALVAEATSSTGSTLPLLLGTMSEETAFGKDCTLLDAAVAGWAGGWRAKLFATLNWRDRVRLARFALKVGQRA